ncbi:MAG: P-loop NTPase [Oscillospiraceae bacterium]|nr:P-loop NTPase [Oscillospiraceae bacterium]
MGELIAVLSGKGGTGKTSVCAGITTALAAAGKKVLCIDCDVGLRNLDISLGMSDCGALSFLEVNPEEKLLPQAASHPSVQNLHFLTAPMNCPAASIDTIAFGQLMLAARKEFDYIFLDAPAGVEAGFRLTASYADRCILVTGPGPAAIRDAARVGDLLELMGKTNIRLIVNRVSRKMVNATDVTVDDVMDTAGLPLLGVIPEDLNMTLAATFGHPLLHYRRRCAAAKAFRRIARRIQGLPEPIALR